MKGYEIEKEEFSGYKPIKAEDIPKIAAHIVAIARCVDPERTDSEEMLAWLGGNTFSDAETEKIYAVIEELEPE